MDNVNSAPGATAKGISFLGVFKFIKTRPQGEDLLEKVLAALSAAAAGVCRKKVISVGDYPYPMFAEFLRTVDIIAGKGDLSLCRDLGVFTAIRDFEFLLQSTSSRLQLKPADLFRDCNRYWKSYYTNAGYMKAESSSPDNAVIRIYDFPAMDRAHCRLMEGWMDQAMVLAGAVWTETFREVFCTSLGDPYHEFTGKWKMKEASNRGV
jgi:hypothetical protein